MTQTIDTTATATGAITALIAAPTTGPAWLVERRAAASQTLAAHGFPTPRDEEWRYTSVKPIEQADLAPAAPGAAIDPEWIESLSLDIDTIRVVLVDGFFSAELSSIPAELPDGVTLQSLAASLEDERVATHLGAIAPEQGPVFTALNTAGFADGVFFALRRKVELTTPVHLIHVTTGAHAAHPRVLCALAEQSSAQLIQTFAGPGGTAYLLNAVTEVDLAAGASLKHLKLQLEGHEGFHVDGWAARQARDSRLSSVNLSLGGKLVRNDITAALIDTGIETRLDGLGLAGDDRLVDNHTTIDHRAPHCESHELYKTVLGGNARGVFNGRVFVRQDAQKTDAKQENRSLLLTDTARIDTKPQLEIFADDVKCTHGATVGQLDEASLFYMRARGIPPETARRPLTYAFCGEVSERVTIAGLDDELHGLLLDRVGALLDDAAGEAGE